MAFGKRKERVKTEYNEPLLWDYALGALGRRMRTVSQMRLLLRRKVADRSEYGEVLVETVMARLREQKLLDDERFAEIFSSYRRDNEKFGKRRVQNDLRSKGVKAEVIDSALGETYAEVNDEQQARDYVRRKRMKKPTNEKETARIFRRLIRAGFGAKTIFAVLKQWDVDVEALGVVEEEAQEEPQEHEH